MPPVNHRRFFLSLHLILLCHAATRAMREGAFPQLDEPIDDGGVRKAQTRRLKQRDCLSSPSLAARQTADTLGIGVHVDEALRDMDYGDWAGHSFARLHGDSPDKFAQWMADPASGAPGGEPLTAVCDRMTAWMNDLCSGDGDRLAITHPMVIRAAIAAALDISPEATLRIDIAPLTQVHLSWNRVWRLQGITS